MINDLPNVMIVPENPEKPWDIVQDYFEMIMEYKDDPEAVKYFLQDMFDDVNYWSVKQMLIDQAKIAMGHLQDLEECEHAFIEDDDFEVD